MHYSFKKYLITLIVLLTVFTSGIIIGHTNQTSAEQSSAIMPNTLKGIHSVPATGSVDVAFSPAGGITEMITNTIAKANKSVYVQAYSFTSPEIIKALIDAKKRGIDVRIIVDKSNVSGLDKNSSRAKKLRNLYSSLINNAIPLKVDDAFQIAHSKIMIIDGIDVITGSFNFSYSAEHNNAENCLILHGNKQLSDEYMKNWQWRWDATENYSM
ncbi:MAG: phospholipase D/transphosphatidylase [Firmicutes bacterium]|nr:phospholipase D/transphosphatidylase [Bacillota bacterium]